MEQYLERCKLRHALAFCQFRKILPGAKLSDLKEMFEDRKDYIQRVLSKVSSITKAAKKGIPVPEAPKFMTSKEIAAKKVSSL